MKESSVFFGTPVARCVTLGLLALLLLVGIILSDRMFARYEEGDGTVEKYWPVGGVISQGTIASPKENEQGAQTTILTVSPRMWQIEVRTRDRHQVVTCSKPPDGPGQSITFRQMHGWMTGLDYGDPTCS